MRSIFERKRREELLRRLDQLRQDSPRRWGRMSAHHAVCHLSDSFKACLGDRPLPSSAPDVRRRIMRFTAFTLPLPWPKGVPTSAQVDPLKEGSSPGSFAEDVAALKKLITRFAETDGSLAPHYTWGRMSRGEWGRYGYRHVDHHLRQFGA